jgi:hypothetical protein
MARLKALGNTPLVLTCRLHEYIEAVAEQVLDRAAVLEVIPVEPATATAYLVASSSAASARWDAVARALEASAGNPCKEALRSPLMLSLARTVYRAPASDPGELTRYATASQIEDRLLDGLIPAVYGRDPTDMSPEDAHRYLSFLAKQLPLLGPGAIAWWRLPLCLSRREAVIVVGLTYGFAASLWMAIFFLLVLFLTPLTTLVASLSVALIVGLSGSMLGMAVSYPAQWRRPTRRDLTRGLKAGLRPGVIVGLTLGSVFTAVGILVGLPVFPLDGLFLAVAGGLLAVIAFGLAAALSRQSDDAVTPLTAFVNDAKASPMVGFIVGLAVVLAVSILLTLLFPVLWLLSGASVDKALSQAAQDPFPALHLTSEILIIALLSALGSSAWVALRKCATPWYCISIALLARRRKIPTRLLTFLESAYERGVLRQAGMVYEFRHARLLERLGSTAQHVMSNRDLAR